MRDTHRVSDSGLTSHQDEVGSGERFQFGRNWSRFLRKLDEAHIQRAEGGLVEFLGTNGLSGKTFLDVGSGSGLSSLAARRLGAKVVSFDYDPESVACTLELRRRYFPTDTHWTVAQGSVLDQAYLASLGQFDIVYSWGVLHHTGAMWQALENVKSLVKPSGLLFIAIYNDVGDVSVKWLERKRRYNRLPRMLRPLYVTAVWIPNELRLALGYMLSNRFGDYLRELTNYKNGRGMSRINDIVDWIGGYPYEYAQAEKLVKFYTAEGFTLRKLVENSSYGCHQIVFDRQ